jgi:hypothetical protein
MMFNKIININVMKKFKIYNLKCFYSKQKENAQQIIEKNKEHLIFTNNENKLLNIKNIPESEKTLIFGTKFNQKLKRGDIPESVKTVIFGKKFNQKLNRGDIPINIEKIKFPSNYKQEIDINIFFDTLKTIKIGNKTIKLNNNTKDIKYNENYLLWFFM